MSGEQPVKMSVTMALVVRNFLIIDCLLLPLEYDASLRARFQTETGDSAATIAIELEICVLRTRQPLVGKSNLEYIVESRHNPQRRFLLDAHHKSALDNCKPVRCIKLGSEIVTGKFQ